MVAALGASPFGYEVLAVPFRIAGALEGLDAINPEWTPAWSAPQPALLAGAAALVALLAAGAWRARRVDPATGLATGLLALLALSGVRHQGLFFLGAAFLAGELLADLGRARRGGPAAGRNPRLAVVALSALAALWCLWPPPTGPLRPRQGPFRPGAGLEPGRFPERVVDRLEALAGVGPLYNDVAFGGYLLWRLHPPRRVFIDGRNEVNPGLLGELSRARPAAGAWNDLLDRFGVDAALVRYDERLYPVTLPGGGEDGEDRMVWQTPSAVLFPPERYALVAWDDAGMLFLRRTAPREALLAREEYRFVHPENRRATLMAASANESFRSAALEELGRKLEEDPRCSRALALREALTRGGEG
jgi:hypothetical protein